MASPSINLKTPNTSPTPNAPGRWIVPQFGPPSVLKWDEAWDPVAELEGEKVLIRVIVGGIGGVENIQRAGGFPYPPSNSPGFSPGYELTGEIIALGPVVPKTSSLNVGDMVAALPLQLGAHATHIVLPYTQVMRLEHTDDPVKMAALPINYMTSWGLLKKAGADLPPGSTILINAASGGCGTAMAQLVHAFDMGIKMIGLSSGSKAAYLRSLGVLPVDRNAPDAVAQVLALTDGKGVDAAFDPICSATSISNSLACAKKGTGKVIAYGFMGEIASDGRGMARTSSNIYAERLTPHDIPFYGLDVSYPGKPDKVKDFYAIVDKVRQGKLDPVVARLFRLDDALTAHEVLVEASQVMGKMHFVVDGALAGELRV